MGVLGSALHDAGLGSAMNEVAKGRNYIAKQRARILGGGARATRSTDDTPNPNTVPADNAGARAAAAADGGMRGISSYKKGGKIKKTGVVKVHKGERVMNVKQTKKLEKSSPMMAVLGVPKKAK